MNPIVFGAAAFVTAVGLLAAIFAAGVVLGRRQVQRRPAVYGLGPLPKPTISVPSTVTEEELEHMHAAFLAAVRAGRFHGLDRGPVIPQ